MDTFITRYHRTVLSLAALAIFLFVNGAGVADEVLPKSISSLLAEHGISPRSVSLEVTEMASHPPSKVPLLSVNPRTSRNPASVIKLLTTLAALELLGPGYQWQTTYLTDGVITAGVLQGDLILRGGGDPFITVEQLLGHILALRQLGIVSIAGKLVLDNSRFAVHPHDRSVFDGRPQRLYNVEPAATLINLSATDFMLKPIGKKLHITASPPLAGLKIVNQIVAQRGACRNSNAGWSYQLKTDGNNIVAHFSGVYRLRCGSHSITRSILPNTDYTHRLFLALWRLMGGKMAFGYRLASTPQSAQVLLARDSDSLADIITGINKFSNNVMSRQLLLSLDAESNESPARLKSAIKIVRKWLAMNRIKTPRLVLKNGSGLSRKTRISARGLSALLAHGWRSTYRSEFVSSLPLAAVDGTMRERLNETPLHGRARIKTGLVDGVRSMAGYVHTRSGKHYSVVMLLDSRKINFWNGNEIQDAVLKWVYER